MKPAAISSALACAGTAGRHLARPYRATAKEAQVMLTGHAHMLAALNPLSSTSLLTSLGTLGVFLVMFAETGLLIGFFLPGDSLLFTAGLLCTGTVSHAAHLSLPLVILAAAGGALLGAQTGFYIGRAGGRPLLQRSRNPYLRTGVERAGRLLDRYGQGKAIVLARFIPVVRTVLNPLAGALDVPTRTFTIWQVVGGLLWSVGVTLAGYTLGSAIPGIDTYLLPAIAVIVVLSLIPIGLEVYRTRAEIRRGGGARPDDDQDGADDGSGAPDQATTARRPAAASQRRAGHDHPGDQ
jgi:membrane-associated protein